MWTIQCVWGKQANMYLQQRITLQQKLRVFAFFKWHLQLFLPDVLSFQTKFLPEEPQAELVKASSAVAFTFSTKYIYTVILRMFQLHKYAQVCGEYFI